MSVKDDGGAAFPTQSDQDVRGDFVQGQQGMSLRDYFAAKAMQALIASSRDFTADEETSVPMMAWSDYAKGSYQVADAMLEARKQ